ncbi:MAG: class I SAM-dependent methyltransferase [Spirochaetaceae bacterium]|nr:class I SAM-dependent methyltransferase [Spirochaetaceae bacterium]
MDLEYLRSFITSDNSIIDKIEKESAGRDDIQPYVEPETGRFLSFIIKLINASNVLELGTGIGNSSIWIGEALKDKKGKLITIDNHPRTKHEAEKNILDSGLDNIITMIFGNAEDIIEAMCKEGKLLFDVVFQDCGKYLYPLLYEKIITLVRPGGLIIADDTLFYIDSTVRKNLGKYMDQYNKIVFADKRLYSTIIPVGHGLTLSLKL